MGWDRVRIFNGVENESTLITGDKNCQRAVYSNKFKSFARHLGYTAREIVDIRGLQQEPYLQERINNGWLQIAEVPEKVREVNEGFRWGQTAVELKPPVSEETLQVLVAYFQTFCECNDAGIIIDNRPDRAKSIGEF